MNGQPATRTQYREVDPNSLLDDDDEEPPPVNLTMVPDIAHSYAAVSKKPPKTVQVSKRNANHVDDMTLSVSTKGVKMLVRDCVKKVLFRKLKFFDKRKYGIFSDNTNTVCGLVIRFCNMSAVEANHEWWEKMRPSVMKMHTDHRNNAIKSIMQKFKGKPTCKRQMHCNW
jgi:hypothetical protein